LKKKDDDILDLTRKIEDMSNEFSRMLRVHYQFITSELFIRKRWIKCKIELNWHNGIPTVTLK